MSEIEREQVELSTNYKRSNRKKSLVWNWFGYKFVNNKLQDDEFVYCTICFFEDNLLINVSIVIP